MLRPAAWLTVAAAAVSVVAAVAVADTAARLSAAAACLGLAACVAALSRGFLRWSLTAAMVLLSAGYALPPTSTSGAAGLTPALLAFAVALLSLPRRPERARPAAIATAIALLPAVLSVSGDLSLTGHLLAATWPAMTAALAGALVFFLAVSRAGGSPAAAGGALLLYAGAAVAWSSAANWWHVLWRRDHPDGDVIAMVAVTSTTPGSGWSLVGALVTLAGLAAAALIAHGTLRAAQA